ncbi:LamG-like jellyroll fold domain-containing protein [Labilibaculum euxinus]
MKITPILLVLFFMYFPFSGNGQNSEKNSTVKFHTEWLVADLLQQNSKQIKILGQPKLVDSPYGKAVSFNGSSDALILQEMPLKSMKEFTVEMIFCPDINASFEQRILHIGEVLGNRMLLEIRAVTDIWYFDGFAASGNSKKALINEQLTHQLGQWYHVALVVRPNSLTTFVNGKKELSESFSYQPIGTGNCSIGVRLNKRSWFKGMIYKIRIVPQQLNPDDFMIY